MFASKNQEMFSNLNQSPCNAPSNGTIQLVLNRPQNSFSPIALGHWILGIRAELGNRLNDDWMADSKSAKKLAKYTKNLF